jgi:hypothetical protein
VFRRAVDQVAAKHTDTMSRRRRSCLPRRRLLCDVVTLARLALTPGPQLAAETCFSGSSWRSTKSATSSQDARTRQHEWCSFCSHGCWTWRPLLTVVQPKHAHQMAPSRLAAPLAVEVATRRADDSGGCSATHREHDPGEGCSCENILVAADFTNRRRQNGVSGSSPATGTVRSSGACRRTLNNP